MFKKQGRKRIGEEERREGGTLGSIYGTDVWESSEEPDEFLQGCDESIPRARIPDRSRLGGLERSF